MGWEPVANYQEDVWQVTISGLRVFWHLLAWSKSKWCIWWIIVFMLPLPRNILAQQLRLVVSTVDRTKSPVCKLVTSKQQVKPSYSDWMKSLEFATKVFTSGNRTTRNPQKYVSPCPNSFDPLTCCSCFLPDAITILTFLEWTDVVDVDEGDLLWSWRNFHKRHTIAEHMDLVK